MSIYRNLALTAPRPSIVKALPAIQPAYRATQEHMFGVANKAGLSTKPAAKQAMLDGINALFGSAFTSRTQLTIEEMQAFTVAIEAGAFNLDWSLSGRVQAEVVVSVEISLVASAPRCSCCKERPVAYLAVDELGELVDGESGRCRECVKASEIEEEQGSDTKPASLETIENSFNAEVEAAHDAAVSSLEERVASLSKSISALSGVINDPQAFHSRQNLEALFDRRRELRNERVALRARYPFLTV